MGRAFAARVAWIHVRKATLDDSVKIKCKRCNSSFRDRAGRLRDGYSRECPNCSVLIFFDSESTDANVRKALTEARRVRNLMSS
jgi:DNA-directed RNA polymerase subunit RPC12/RpoP